MNRPLVAQICNLLYRRIVFCRGNTRHPLHGSKACAQANGSFPRTISFFSSSSFSSSSSLGLSSSSSICCGSWSQCVLLESLKLPTSLLEPRCTSSPFSSSILVTLLFSKLKGWMQVFGKKTPYLRARLVSELCVDSIKHMSAGGVSIDVITEILVCRLQSPD